MRHHRFRDEPALPFLRHQQVPMVAPAAFLACPAAWGGGPGGLQALYQMALRHAQAVHQPSLPERLLRVSTN